jgi:hypothetical protein
MASRMADSQSARAKQLQTGIYWHIVFPLLVLVLILFVLFVIYTMPDWALTCSEAASPIRRFASGLPK